MVQLEVIVTTLAEARAAVAGGALSLEIIEDLSVGGLTPPLEVVRAIRDAVTVDLNVMLRPHARSFVYTPQDIEVIHQQAQAIARIGVTSVVFGALTPDGDADLALTRQVAAAAATGLTFHRALDETRAPAAALDSLQGIATRILCSGGAANIWDGRTTMRQWVRTFPQFTFACAGGVTLENLPELVRVTQAQQIHVGTAARTNGTVDREKVRALVAALT
ncbi:MAG: copper homeostasis protein CutC [Anaerolineae bacterium]